MCKIIKREVVRVSRGVPYHFMILPLFLDFRYLLVEFGLSHDRSESQGIRHCSEQLTDIEEAIKQFIDIICSLVYCRVDCCAFSHHDRKNLG